MAKNIKNTVFAYTHPTAGLLIAAPVKGQRSKFERALESVGLATTYQVLTEEAEEGYDGPGADIALENIGSVYVVDGDMLTPLLPTDDVIANLRTHAANALAALDSGDMDAVRAALVAASEGAPASVEIAVQDDEQDEQDAYEPSDLELQVLDALNAAQSATVNEIAEKVEGDVETAITTLHDNALVVLDGHNAAGETAYAPIAA